MGQTQQADFIHRDISILGKLYRLLIKLVLLFIFLDIVFVPFLKIFSQNHVSIFPDSLHSSLKTKQGRKECYSSSRQINKDQNIVNYNMQEQSKEGTMSKTSHNLHSKWKQLCVLISHSKKDISRTKCCSKYLPLDKWH